MDTRSAQLALLAALALNACSGEARAPVERVILLTCDTLRADRLGVYGYERDTSPRLDALARECLVFDEAYACAPMTQPAVASLLTGLLPGEVGAVPGNLQLMPADVETLAERLRAEGLATAAVVANYVLRRSTDGLDVGAAQGFVHYDDSMPRKEGNRPVFEKRATDTTEAAIRWLSRRQDDSFFLWVHYQDPHGPYKPPDSFARLFQSPRRVEPLLPLGNSHRGRGQLPGYQILRRDVRDPAVYRDRYDAEIRYFDTEVGRLLDWLRAEGLLDGALLVFTADHGEALGEHDYWFCHGETVYRDSVRVPLFVRWPDGTVPAGFGPAGADAVHRSASVASHLDVVPTVLEALDLGDAGTRGASLFSEPPPADRVLPQDLWPAEGESRWWGASDGRFRLVWSESFDGARLFDVTADPGEETDLAAEQPDRVAALRDAHRAFVAAGSARSGQGMEVDSEAREALRALGYADGEDAEDGAAGGDG